MDYADPEHWPSLKQLASTIHELDYFQVLNLSPTASGPHIRASYYGLARALHPDKFFHIPDAETKIAIHTIYKRIVESYMVLKDERKRLKYIANIGGADREKKLRFDEQAEAEQREEAKSATKIAKTQQGEKLYQAALLDIAREQWDKAYRNIQTALMFEAQNSDFKSLLSEIEGRRKSPAD